ncbi:hypothetical protein [Streptomyces sp. NPDC015131]|uniref:hypothetical protein n=1 Tax=Streptomyces sp. NPDC015131 TaxID=3364941 RepID=UPI0036F99CA6
MIPNPRSGLPRAVLPAIGLSIMLALTTSCSSPEREYAVPGDLCGVRVPAKALEPVLPAGKEATLHPSAIGENKRCRIHVDGKSVFSASIEPWEKDAKAQDVARVTLSVEPSDTLSKDRRYIYSPTGAVGRVECPAPPDSKRSVWATVRVTHDDATEADMKNLIEAYAKAVAASGACREMLGG